MIGEKTNGIEFKQSENAAVFVTAVSSGIRCGYKRRLGGIVRDEQHIPPARGSVGYRISTAVYIFVTLLSVTAYPSAYNNWFEYISDLGNLSDVRAVPAFYAAGYYLGNTGMILLFCALFAMIATSLIANLWAVSRMIHVIGQDPILPDRLAKLTKKQIPVNAMLFVGAVSLFVICFTVYLWIFRRDYYENPRSIAMIYVLLTLFTVAASLMVSHTILHVYIMPFAMVPIFIRVFMDSRSAFMAHTTMVLICAAVLQHPLEFIAVEEIAGIVAIFSLRELSSRSQLFWTAVLITISTMLVNLSLW